MFFNFSIVNNKFQHFITHLLQQWELHFFLCLFTFTNLFLIRRIFQPKSLSKIRRYFAKYRFVEFSQILLSSVACILSLWIQPTTFWYPLQILLHLELVCFYVITSRDHLQAPLFCNLSILYSFGLFTSSVLSVVCSSRFATEQFQLSQLMSTFDNRIQVSYIAILFFLNLFPLFTPRVWYPVQPNVLSDIPSTEQTCSLFSLFFTYGWLNDIIFKAWKSPVSLADMPALPNTDQTLIWFSAFQKQGKKGLITMILYSLQSNVLFLAVLSVIVSLTTFISPYAIKNLLQYLQTPQRDTSRCPIHLLLMLLFGPYVASVIKEYSVHISRRFMLRTKAGISQLIYEKVVHSKISQITMDGSQANIDHIYNLLASDVDNIANMREFISFFVRGPIDVGIAMFFLHRLLGWSAYVGVLLAISSALLPLLISSKLAELTSISNRSSDDRIRFTTEILRSIRVTKFFGWEKPMLQKVREKRNIEIANIWRLNILDITFKSCMKIAPFLSMFITFATFTKVMDRELSPSIAFTSISLFSVLRNQFITLSGILRQMIQFRVSINRVSLFLAKGSEPNETPVSHEEISFTNASLSWCPFPSSAQFQLRELNFTIPRDQFTLVLGATGSGKTTLAAAILGELHLTSGKMNVPLREECVGYVPQTSWLRNDTIRANILFGEIFDEYRYRKVIEASCLEADLERLHAGDLTFVQSNGSSLSGGQKQRISLARALYLNSNVYIFDDIFSALDIATSKKVYKNCFESGLLKGKTVILFTHNINLSISMADNVILLENATAKFVPSKEIKGQSSFLSAQHNGASHEPAQTNLSTDPHENMYEDNVVSAEEEATTGVCSAVKPSLASLASHYMSYFGSSFFLTICGSFVLLTQLMIASINFWVAVWSGQSHKGLKLPFSFSFLQGYAFLLVIYFSVDLMRGGLFSAGGRRASRSLHERVSERVFGSPLHWFEKTAIGRVINRFSKDIASVDNMLWVSIENILCCLMALLMGLGNVTIIMPIFIAPAVLVCIVVYGFAYVYSKAQKQLTACSSSQISPVFSLLGETLSGLTIIRAFRKEEAFEIENMAVLDHMLQSQFVSYAINRWLAIRTDGISGLVGFLTALIAIWKQNIPTELVGFSLNSAVGLNLCVLVFVRASNELITHLNSYHRLNEYSNLPLEEHQMASGCQLRDEGWPRSGSLDVQQLTVHYGMSATPVLEDISLKVAPKEKLAIVGRTGSGKSTLGLSLLRFTNQTSGSVQIDGVDINTLQLETLRQRVSLIPQDPVLISGTVRSNLDPFEQVSDEELNDVLQVTSCDTLVTTGSGTAGSSFAIQLDTPVETGGTNFSQGQRQILALARALVRKSRIIILDESTASVDDTTDRRIQEMLRRVFREATVLCIAHRIKTVLDYDKILVLDAGKVIEYGSPKSLYWKRGSFWAMCQQSQISL
ncbi:ABC transmembrane transporter Abc1/Ybt1 [Schizosaccharomyces osmophilus]|uniref:ABC transmembrane transporter Abc1/Ybt1 n=1 Tax=Schizosaccharomyces osmophilus TaxID=2545709 RepID=A0AAE9WE62_9SCHI|nr:ABC transmembrane transporter Abc1/Ybt1 [Schizosaccharomyces osmophilus]WBW73572.1 ABC transmembrane transporter Abc1/Ybt1 [Schizosaccharomyces osmophilus]